MAESSEERTEAPTPRRIRDLRRKNVVLRSQELVSALGLVAIVAVMPMLVSRLWEASASLMRFSLAESAQVAPSELLGFLLEAAGQLFLPLVLPVSLVLLAAAAGSVLLSGGRPNLFAVKPRVDMLSPKTGIKRVLGVQGLVEAGKGLAKLTAAGLVAWTMLPAAYAAFMTGTSGLGGFLAELGSDILTLAWRLALVGVVIGLLDLAWSRRRYRKQARMTRTEVKQDTRSSEGDPLVKAARRQQAARMARQRMMEAVPTATVVLVNPTHVAVALRYSGGDAAPVVVARGSGIIAQRIRERAAQASVPVRRHEELARALFRSCRVGDAIPADLYAAVAAVLAAILRPRRRS